MTWAEIFFYARFRKVSDGWIFIGPAARLFGKRDRYLVNDAQRAEVLAAAPSLGLLCTFLALNGVVGTALAIVLIGVFTSVYGHLPAETLQLWLITLIVVTLVGVAVIGFMRTIERRLIGLVADLPVTTAKITRQEVEASLSGPAGRRIAFTCAAGSAFFAAGSIVSILSNHATLTVTGVLWMLLSLRLAYAAIKLYAAKEHAN